MLKVEERTESKKERYCESWKKNNWGKAKRKLKKIQSIWFNWRRKEEEEEEEEEEKEEEEEEEVD